LVSAEAIAGKAGINEVGLLRRRRHQCITELALGRQPCQAGGAQGPLST
jgi:hypothetical protein